MKTITLNVGMDDASKNLVAKHGSAVEALRMFQNGGELIFSDKSDSVSMLLALYGIAIIELANAQET